VLLKELADKLEISTRQLESDLELLSLVGKPPLTPDHLIDLYVEEGVVYVELDQSLSRPLRLTHEEARALVLAAKLVGNLGGVGEQLENVLSRMTEVLNPVDKEIVQSLSMRIGLSQDASADWTNALRLAVDAHQEVEIDYYSASSDKQKTYLLQPLALLSHAGIEYLVALDTQADMHEKLFRLDRVGFVKHTGATFKPPVDFDLERFRTQRLYFGQEELTATVRFSSRVAPSICERFAREDVVQHEDGSVDVQVSTSSPAWLMRWVLPFGIEAEIIAPPSMREHVAAFCRAAVG